MGVKIKQAAPVAKMWIWLKPVKSKSMEDFRSEFGIEKARELSSKWIESSGIDSDGDFRDVVGLPGATFIYKKEVAHVCESVERPKNLPAKPAPKAKWKPRTIEIPSKATRPVLVDLVHECVAEINELGDENARLKNQLAKEKSK